jgi:hypothetical protein
MVANMTDDNDASPTNIAVSTDADTSTEVPMTKMETENYVTYSLYTDKVEVETTDGITTTPISGYEVVSVDGMTENEFKSYESECKEYLTGVLNGQTAAGLSQTSKYTIDVTDSEGVTYTLKAIESE